MEIHTLEACKTKHSLLHVVEPRSSQRSLQKGAFVHSRHHPSLRQSWVPHHTYLRDPRRNCSLPVEKLRSWLGAQRTSCTVLGKLQAGDRMSQLHWSLTKPSWARVGKPADAPLLHLLRLTRLYRRLRLGRLWLRVRPWIS